MEICFLRSSSLLPCHRLLPSTLFPSCSDISSQLHNIRGEDRTVFLDRTRNSNAISSFALHSAVPAFGFADQVERRRRRAPEDREGCPQLMDAALCESKFGAASTPFFGRGSSVRRCYFGEDSQTIGVPKNASVLAAKESQTQFVNWFREAWPYIQGHQGNTFVILISAEIIEDPRVDGILQDISLLHGLGIKLVIIPGTHLQIDKLLQERGYKPGYVGSYRVTDAAALEASMEVAGKFRLSIEAKLSRGPSIPVLRRHGENDRLHVGVGVASGNFVAAKRRGVVEGVDFGATGEVKRIDVARIKERLEDNCIVILSNLGYSSCGEVLNCNTYEVATACAKDLQAEKLICFLDGPFLDKTGRLIRFMTLQGADALVRKWAEESETAANYVKAVAGIDYMKSLGIKRLNTSKESTSVNGILNSSTKLERDPMPGINYRGHEMSSENGNGSPKLDGQGFAIGGKETFTRAYGYLSELTAAVFVCRGGVRRVHLLDATIEGALLLELYTRDGIGTMVASDLYEGTREAELGDVPRIEELLRPLEESGVLVNRTHQQLIKEIGSFTVVERDGSIMACAALFSFYEEKCGEVAALAVSRECRGHGQGDKLLDYMENKAIKMGLKRLFLLTTRTADWFVQRGFSQCTIDFIPKIRQEKINLARGSKYYMKNLISSNVETDTHPNRTKTNS